MPSHENLLAILEKILISPNIQRIHDKIVKETGKMLDEWGDEEWTEFLRECEQLLPNMLNWVRRYLEQHPCEDCILEALSPECTKIEKVQRCVMDFVEKIKKEENLTDLGSLIPLGE